MFPQRAAAGEQHNTALGRDTFGEDASTARTGTGPHVIATLRKLVISILRIAGHASIASALRQAARDPARAFWLLTRRK